MINPSSKQPIQYWTERRFWGHLLLLFSIFVYLYSPLFDHALGQYIHTRPHNHIPVRLVQHDDHFHQTGDATHAEPDTAEAQICTLEFTGLILLSIFMAFITYSQQPFLNVIVYNVDIDWVEVILNGYPPPHPPPRIFA